MQQISNSKGGKKGGMADTKMYIYICIEQKILLLFAVTSYLPSNGGCPAQVRTPSQQSGLIGPKSAFSGLIGPNIISGTRKNEYNSTSETIY